MAATTTDSPRRRRLALKPPRSAVALAAGAVLGFCAALSGGVLADRENRAPGVVAPPGPAGLAWQEAARFGDVYARIKREYVDMVDDHALIEKAVRGMVAGLDPHAAYLDDDELDEMRRAAAGSYPGVGVEVSTEGGHVKILRPIEGSPAQRAGLLAGDEIVRIDDTDVGADPAFAMARMRGPSGSLVRLGVRRAAAPDLLEFALQRARVEMHSVAGQTLEPGFGYLRISAFSDTTAQELSAAVFEIKRDNPAGIKGILIDMRNNPGGVLEAGVAVADAFLDAGVIVTADGRTPESRFRMEATPGDLADGAPLVVLVNGGSASAAEIVAGALRDHARALLVGRRTYGKGSVQTVIPLAEGGAVKLTTSRYFTPSGTSIHGRGIVPDIVEDGPGEAPAALSGEAAVAPLAVRDPDVRIALDVLKRRVRTRPAAPALAGGFVP